MPGVVLSPTPGETPEFVPEESEISVRAGERSRRGSMRPAGSPRGSETGVELVALTGVLSL